MSGAFLNADHIHLSKFDDCFETKFCDVRVVWYFHLSQARIRSWRRGLDNWNIILCVRRDKDLNTHQELCQTFWYVCDLTSCAYWQNIALPFLIKEEIQTRFNLISEERVKILEQNSENLMKIGWKIRKLWHFEVSQIFKKHFLTSRYEYANEWVDDVIASQFSIHFVHRNDKNFIFQLWEC